MAIKCGNMKSPRNGIVYDSYPTVSGHVYPNSCGTRHPRLDYGAVLDSILEMSRDVMDANCVSVESAINQVLEDEAWRILPKQRRDISERLRAYAESCSA